ncbi:MAG: DUF5522 domain-containing protein [Bacteroidota bacterium]
MNPGKPLSNLREGIDYYIERGLFVFTSTHHLKRGYCCESGCRDCPYGFEKNKEGDTTDETSSKSNR